MAEAKKDTDKKTAEIVDTKLDKPSADDPGKSDPVDTKNDAAEAPATPLDVHEVENGDHKPEVQGPLKK